MGTMVHSRVVSIAIFGLLQENVSLISMEVVSYLAAFVQMLHIHSSGKRNATMLIAAALQSILLDQLWFRQTRWHAQAWLMLIPERLPVFFVLHQAQAYYMAFVATSRLRIDNVLQPLAMGVLVMLLLFPFEMLGSKFIWWTWHDTDPMLHDRFMSVPIHALFYHMCFGISFHAAHQALQMTWLRGDYYEEEHWRREWSYVALLPLLSLCCGTIVAVLFYHVFVQLLNIQMAAWFLIFVGICLVLLWMADRERDEQCVQESLAPVDAYDSDWLYPTIDHAVNQMLFIFSFVLLILILLVDPSEIISVGHHQPLGNCVEIDHFRTLLGLRMERKKHLCVHEFEEEFNLCNYPVAQLHYEESWYMICGRGFNNKETYIALIVAAVLGLNLLFYQILKRPKQTRSISFAKKYM